MSHSQERPLRTSLIILLILAILVSSAVVGSLILVLRLPQITQENADSVQFQANELTNRINVLMTTLETRLALVGDTTRVLPKREIQAVFDEFIERDPAFSALYLLNPNGTVEEIGLPTKYQQWRSEMLGRDMSLTRIYLASITQQQTIWHDKHISVIAGNKTVALALAVESNILIAEVPISYILDATRLSSGVPDLSTWIIDQYGDVIVDTDGMLGSGVNNLMNLPIIQVALSNEPLPVTFSYQNKKYHPASARAEKIDWIFLSKMPAGLDNPHVQATLLDMAALFVGSIMTSLLLAPWWAERMARPLRDLMRHARSIALNDNPGQWPHSHISEFNELSANLAQMALAMREREHKFLAIFNDTPVAMLVINPNDNYRILEVNQTWGKQFGYQKYQVIGHTCSELQLWPDDKRVTDFISDNLENNERIETPLTHRDGHLLQCMISSQRLHQDERPMIIMVMEDITERRRMERELRQLTVELEQRVKLRTEDLEHSNRELSATLESLRLAQSELIRAEKLAALGELVAGVAHELNTPLGNSIMAISTLKDQAKEFNQNMSEGLKRSALDKYIANVRMASDIADRNLARAAELVNSFKQVAVDQASSQRRQFDLQAVVDEILLTLRPSFKRTPYQIETQIPEHILLDSYPGPLGQAITNLITNALLHGFDGRDHGHISIKAELQDPQTVRIELSDDGHGIPAELQGKIFVPFFTTKMGRGGTGLGLHIVHNTVNQILGGKLTLHSDVGKGTQFTLWIPLIAPHLKAVEA